MFHKNRVIILFICIAVIFLMFTNYSHAACSYASGDSAQQIRFNIPSITIQRDATPGTIVWSGQVNSGMQVSLTCSGQSYNFSATQGSDTGHVIYGNYKVYSTNIPGLGYTLSSDCKGGSFSSNMGGCVAGSSATAFPQSGPASNGTFGAGGGLYGSMALVVTGTLSPGYLSAGQYGNFTVGGTGWENYTLSNSPYINVASCSISAPNLVFPIGNVLTSSFGSNIGTIPSGAQNTQNLGLNCDAQANINVSLSGTQNPDVGTTSVLALTGQGGVDVAKGVGVQIIYNGSPLVLNNRIVLKQSSGGQETFPLTARYYQTKTSVTTGTANASATLNLTYQ